MSSYEIFKYISLIIFIFFTKYKINPNSFSSILLGVGTGIIANVMFVLTTSTDYNAFKLMISSVFGIILLILGSIEKKEKDF